ncbi:MAG: acetate--CoA ligase family protein, partial [Pseudomonadota bacterium]
RAALGACFEAMMAGDLALGCVILDFPRADRCDRAAWMPVLDAVEGARKASGKPMAIVSSLPETMPEDVAAEAIRRGIAPLSGLDSALEAIEVAAKLGAAFEMPGSLLLPGLDHTAHLLSEADAKAELARFGLCVPEGREASTAAEAGQRAEALGFPVVLKGAGLAHKTEAGAVALGLSSKDAVEAEALCMGRDAYLVEEMIQDGVAELLIGVLRDRAHGFVLTLGAGGQMAELLDDTTSLILPVQREDVEEALDRLRIAPLLAGYRGAAGADRESVVDAVLTVQDYVVAHGDLVHEVEINPLICTPTRAVAADALIRMGEPR